MTLLIYGDRSINQTARDLAATLFDTDRADCLDIALINNMPEAARRATERQYLRLFTATSDGFLLRIKFYAFDVRRERPTGCNVDYHEMSALWESHHDALIMTGTEPNALNLTEEFYWPILAQTIDWCQNNVASAIWSCLAAHAAVLYLDGIKRRPLKRKCFGIFPCERSRKHPLLHGLSLPLWVQHSRWNAVDAEALKSAGYTILTASHAAGVDTFIKESKCVSLFFQGHPEYEPDTLLREYRRDVARYLNYENDNYPNLPEGYFEKTDAAALLSFQERAMVSRDEVSISDLPLPAAPPSISQLCTFSHKLYRNWLAMLLLQKAKRLHRARTFKKSAELKLAG
jgi:homoserine O-succinyltransferase/O-acetyltransferase